MHRERRPTNVMSIPWCHQVSDMRHLAWNAMVVVAKLCQRPATQCLCTHNLINTPSSQRIWHAPLAAAPCPCLSERCTWRISQQPYQLQPRQRAQTTQPHHTPWFSIKNSNEDHDRSNTNPVFSAWPSLIKTFNNIVVHWSDCACPGWSRNVDQQPSTWSAAAVLTRTVPRRPATPPSKLPHNHSIAFTNCVSLPCSSPYVLLHGW